MRLKISAVDVDAAFNLWLSGYSLRQLGRIYKVSYETIRKRFKKAYGANYNQYRNGIYRVIVEDYLKASSLKEADRKSLENWLKNHSAIDLRSIDKYYTDDEIKNLSKNECGYTEDFRTQLNYRNVN